MEKKGKNKTCKNPTLPAWVSVTVIIVIVVVIIVSSIHNSSRSSTSTMVGPSAPDKEIYDIFESDIPRLLLSYPMQLPSLSRKCQPEAIEG